MNINNINKLIEVIRDEDNFFNMYNYTFKMDRYHSDADDDIVHHLNETGQPVPSCGTPACLAGWGSYLSGGDTEKRSIESMAKEWLDLDDFQSYYLFHPVGNSSREWLGITRQQAFATLEHLKETGLVAWK